MSKTRESGMPEEELWAGFFTPTAILQKLSLTRQVRKVAEFGCGYGTFTIPAAQMIDGTIYAYDIEPEMVEATAAKAQKNGLQNIHVEQRDFVANGTGLPDETVDYVMLFNLLHAEEREVLLRETMRILRPGGLLGVIHWNYDPTTPRGPSMEIRPKPEQCRLWAESVGFQCQTESPMKLPPYHYGWLFNKPKS